MPFIFPPTAFPVKATHLDPVLQGDLDAFVTTNAASTVWFNDGNGAFTDSHSATAMGDADRSGLVSRAKHARP